MSANVFSQTSGVPRFYYNAVIANRSGAPAPARFEDTRLDSALEDTTGYFVALSRMSVQGVTSAFPILRPALRRLTTSTDPPLMFTDYEVGVRFVAWGQRNGDGCEWLPVGASTLSRAQVVLPSEYPQAARTEDAGFYDVSTVRTVADGLQAAIQQAVSAPSPGCTVQWSPPPGVSWTVPIPTQPVPLTVAPLVWPSMDTTRLLRAHIDPEAYKLSLVAPLQCPPGTGSDDDLTAMTNPFVQVSLQQGLDQPPVQTFRVNRFTDEFVSMGQLTLQLSNPSGEPAGDPVTVEVAPGAYSGNALAEAVQNAFEGTPLEGVLVVEWTGSVFTFKSRANTYVRLRNTGTAGQPAGGIRDRVMNNPLLRTMGFQNFLPTTPPTLLDLYLLFGPQELKTGTRVCDLELDLNLSEARGISFKAATDGGPIGNFSQDMQVALPSTVAPGVQFIWPGRWNPYYLTDWLTWRLQEESRWDASLTHITCADSPAAGPSGPQQPSFTISLRLLDFGQTLETYGLSDLPGTLGLGVKLGFSSSTAFPISDGPRPHMGPAAGPLILSGSATPLWDADSYLLQGLAWTYELYFNDALLELLPMPTRPDASVTNALRRYSPFYPSAVPSTLQYALPVTQTGRQVWSLTEPYEGVDTAARRQEADGRVFWPLDLSLRHGALTALDFEASLPAVPAFNQAGYPNFLLRAATGGGSVPAVQWTQESTAQNSWSVFTGLALCSNTIPAAEELSGYNSAGTSINGAGSDSQNFLFDVDLAQDTLHQIQSGISFSPTILRWAVLRPGYLHRLDLQLKLRKKDGSLVDWMLDAGGTISMKLVFSRFTS